MKNSIIALVFIQIFIGLLIAAVARAADPVPYFKADVVFQPTGYFAHPIGPQPAHPIAAECDFNDVTCIKAHDSRVLNVVLATKDITYCASSTRPVACDETANMVWGNVMMGHDRILKDPCAIVLRVEGNWSLVFSPRFKVTRYVHGLKVPITQRLGGCGCRS